MDININPKYEIGQKKDEQVYSDDKIISTKRFVINNIEVVYDYISKELKYKYELKSDDEFGCTYGWLTLE